MSSETTTKPEEVKKDETKETKKEEVVVKKDRKDMDLVEIIQDVVNTKDFSELSISPRVMGLLKRVSKKEDAKRWENVEAYFKIIVQDKKVDAKDLPVIMSLMQELFILYDGLRLRFTSKEIGDLLKSVVELLVLYRLKDSADLSEEQRGAVMTSLDIFIGLSVEMIDLKAKAKQVNSRLAKLVKALSCISFSSLLSLLSRKKEEVKAEDKKEGDDAKKEGDDAKKEGESKKEEPKAEEKK
jgi:hypothetical protein